MKMKMYNYVRCPCCNEKHEVNSVEFLNIEEDITGRDVMTFVCPETLDDAKSLVFRG